MKHRLGDIVRETGYSTATVSRALNGSSWVAERTRLKILEAARKTGYLRSERTVTLVVPNISIDYYYKYMVSELETMLRFAGFRMELIPVRDLEMIEEHRPSVISIVSEDGLERYWGKKYEIPLVCINTAPRHLEGIFSVHSNEEQGMNMLLNHLYSLGHRRIGLWGYRNVAERQTNVYSSRVRVNTFQRFLEQRGCPCDLTVGHSYSWGETEYSETISRRCFRMRLAVGNGSVLRSVDYRNHAELQLSGETGSCHVEPASLQRAGYGGRCCGLQLFSPQEYGTAGGSLRTCAARSGLREEFGRYAKSCMQSVRERPEKMKTFPQGVCKIRRITL